MLLFAKIAIPIAIVIGAAWAFMSMSAKPAATSGTQANQQQAAPASSKSPGDAISASSSSDASLQADLNSIYTQYQSASQESAAAGQQDQPVSQDY